MAWLPEIEVTTSTGGDPAPDPFAFPDIEDAHPLLATLSAAQTLVGFDSPAPVTVSGGRYSLNGAGYTDAPGFARPGDVLRLNRASVLGSRDLTLLPREAGGRNPRSGEVAYVDERLYECRAVVVGVDSEPMRTKEKTKRSNRKGKTVKSKHRYTVLRISDLRIKAPEELEE